MNSLWKRTLSAFLAMVMVFGMLPVPGYAEEVVEELSEVEEFVEEIAEESMEESEAEEYEAAEEIVEEVFEEEPVYEDSSEDEVVEEEVPEEELALSGDVRKIYFLNTESWEAVWAAWTFDEEAFEDLEQPGVEMEADEVLENVFAVELPVEADAVVFSDGIELTEELLAAEEEAELEIVHEIQALLDAELDYFDASAEEDSQWQSYAALTQPEEVVEETPVAGVVTDDVSAVAVVTDEVAGEQVEGTVTDDTADADAEAQATSYVDGDSLVVKGSDAQPSDDNLADKVGTHWEQAEQFESIGLTCGKDYEHTHVDACYTIPNVDACAHHVGRADLGHDKSCFTKGSRCYSITCLEDHIYDSLTKRYHVTKNCSHVHSLGCYTLGCEYALIGEHTHSRPMCYSYTWKVVKNQYNITWVWDDATGEQRKTIPVKHGDTLTAPSEAKSFEKDGVTYTLTGWEGLTEGATASKEETFTAIFTTKSVITVTYDIDGNTYITQTYNVENGEVSGTVVAPAAPVKSGFVFDGWYTEDEEPFVFGNAPTGNITLYAKWFTDANGNGVDDTTETFKVNFTNATVTVDGKEVTSGTANLYDSTKGTVTVVVTPSSGYYVDVTADGELTGSWKSTDIDSGWGTDNRNVYTGTLTVEEGESYTVTATGTKFEWALTVDAVEVPVNGFRFSGLSDIEDAILMEVFGEECDVDLYDGNVDEGWGSLTIKLGTPFQYKITLKATDKYPAASDTLQVTAYDNRDYANITNGYTNGSEFNTEDDFKAAFEATVKFNETAADFNGLTAIGKNGSINWAKNEDGTYTATVTANDAQGWKQTTKSFENLTWTVAKYAVEFKDWNGSVLLAAENYPYGTAAADIEKPADPTREGYTFTGWNPVVSNVTGNVTYVATYRINQYAVTFKNGDDVVKTETLNYGTAITAPAAPTKEGHTFAGWDVNGDNKEDKVATTMGAGDLNYTALWTVNSYDVIWVWQNAEGEQTTTKTLSYGTAIAVPAEIPTQYKVDNVTYTRTGWTGLTDGATVPVDGITYTATYTTATAWIVDFDSNGGSEVVDVTVIVPEGETNVVEKPVDPTREGYRFDGWYLKGENDELTENAYDFATPVTGDITLTAKWVEQVTVSFDGAEVEAQTFDINGTATEPDDPTKDQAIFAGWYLNGEKYDFTSEVTEDITLTAKWLSDLNRNEVEDANEIISIMVTGEGEIALSDNLIENPISTADTKSYIFDSTNPTITITATPVVTDGISTTYVKSIAGKGAADLTYDEKLAATETVEVKHGDVVEVIFEAVPQVKEPADVVEYNFFTKVIPYEDIYNSVVSAPQILDEETKVEYTYFARPAMKHTVSIDALDLDSSIKTLLNTIGVKDFSFDMEELWLPLDAEIEESVDLETAVSTYLTKDRINGLLDIYNAAHDKAYDDYIAANGNSLLDKAAAELAGIAAGGAAAAADIQAIYDVVYASAYYYGAHEFGYNANGTETVDEQIKITYTHDSMHWNAEATVTLKDSRKISYISGSDLTLTYRDYIDEDILAKFALTDADGNIVAGDIYSVELTDPYTYEGKNVSETAYELMIKFAGNEEFRPAQKIVNVTVTKAGLSIDLPNLNITHGDEYDLYANVTPANRFGDKQEVIDSLVEIIIGLDVADLEVTKEGEISGAGAHVQIMLPQDDTLAAIFKTLGLDVYGKEGETLKFDELQGYLDQLDGLLGSFDSGNETVDGITSVLESITGLVDLNNVEITFGGSYPTDVGVYLYGAVSTSGNYETAFDVAYMLIKPAVAEVDIAWNYVDENYIFSKQVLQYFDLGAHIVEPEKYDAETLKKLELLTFFAGVDENGKFVTAWDGAELGNGAYAEIAFLIEFGNELYYAVPLARPVMIIPNVVDAQIQVDGMIADEYLLTFDGEPVDAEMIVNTELDLSDMTVEKSLKYYGMKTNGKIYDSEVDPTNAGAYGAVATVIVREKNGDLVGVGADVALLVIEPTTSNVIVEDKIVKNDTVLFRDLVTAESVGTNLKPDTTIITAGIDTNADINEKGWAAVNGVVNIDFPAWMDALLKQYVPSVVDGITASQLKEMLDNKLPDISTALTELGASNEVINALANLTENITKVLDEMPENIKLSFQDDAQANEIGTYIVVAIVTDSDHYPSVDAGYLVVLPDVTEVELKWNHEDENGIFTRDLLELEDVDLLAKAYTDGKEVEADITYQFISIDKNGKLVTYTNPETVPNGVYLEVAYIELYIDGDMIVGDMIARPVVIVASNSKVNFENVETVFDNTNHGVNVTITDLENREITVGEGEKAELTVLYAGLQTNGDPYLSEVAPTHAGVYEALATYVHYDANGELRYYGANAGYVMIDMAESQIAVTGDHITYDGYGHTADVSLSLNGDLINADYTLISGGISVSEDANEFALDAFNTNVNIDFPRWLENALKESGEFEFVDGVDVAYLVRFIKSYREGLIKVITVDKLVEWNIVTVEQQNAYKAKLNAYIDAVIATLEKMPQNVTLTFDNNKTYAAPGVYGYYGIITDSDHYPSTDTGLLVIEKAEVTVTLDSLSKVYGAEDPALTYTVAGLVSGEELTVTASREEGENVGTYAITAEVAHPYYNVSVDEGIFEITKAPVTITVADQTKVYGDLDQAFTSTVTGLVGDDTLDIEYSRETGEDVGEYTIKASAEDDNYNINVEFGILSIIKADVEITVDNKTKVFGDTDPEFTAVIEGMKNGEKLDIEFSRETGEDVGKYTIKADAKNENYNIAVNFGTMTIEAKELTVEDITLAGDLTYNGTVQTQKIQIMDGDKVLVDGKDYKVTDNAETNAGDYAMTITGIGNYAGKITVEWTIAKKTLVVDVQDATKIYGDAEPQYVSTFDGLVDGDKIAVNYSRDEGENVGTYEVSAKVTEDSEDCSNYAITYESGNLIITPAELTVNVSKAEKFYGEGDDAIICEYEVTGYKLSDNDQTVPVIMVRDPESKGENAGNAYKLTASVESKNYTVKIEGANLTIKKAEINVVVDHEVRVKDPMPNPIPADSYTITIEGKHTEEQKAKLIEELKLNVTCEGDTSVLGAVYNVNADGYAKSENYNVSISGNVTITLGDYVCWNTTDTDTGTGVYYTTIHAGLKDAVSGQEIEVLTDVTTAETVLLVRPRITLDLNGHEVRAEFVIGTFADADIIDSQNGAALLVANMNQVQMDEYNDQLPVWNGNNGYVFTEVNYERRVVRATIAAHGGKGTEFVFQPLFNDVVTELLKNGCKDNNITFVARVSYTNSRGSLVYNDFRYTNEVVDEVYTRSGYAFWLALANAESFPDANYSVVVSSGIDAQSESEGMNVLKLTR